MHSEGGSECTTGKFCLFTEQMRFERVPIICFCDTYFLNGSLLLFKKCHWSLRKKFKENCKNWTYLAHEVFEG